VPGLALSAAAFASFSSLNGSIAQWITLWILYTLASLLIRILVWNTAISRAFTASRGLAIAVLLCGGPVAQAAAPIAGRLLIDDVGWRGAYVAFGLGWGGVALLVALLFFHEPRDTTGHLELDGLKEVRPPLGGLTVIEAVNNHAMRRLALAIFIQTTLTVGIMVHLVPMLTESGLTPVQAAGVASLRGVAALVGMIVTGLLVDRVSGGTLPFLAYAGPAVAIVLILFSQGSVVILSIGVIVLGYCSAAAMQLATYLTTRYAGMRSFGTIFGLISSLTAFGAGVGPLLAGAIFDTTGSYSLLLILSAPAALLAGLAVFRLGAYPQFEPPQAVSSRRA
jgi:predicted MFS family arabinose efflux permease